MNNGNTTLTKGVYDLPPTCRAFVRGGKVYVSLKIQVEDSTPRCRNCLHFQKGRHSFNQSREAYVCMAKPKTNGMRNGYPPDINAQKRYFAATGHHKACDKYAPKKSP